MHVKQSYSSCSILQGFCGTVSPVDFRSEKNYSAVQSDYLPRHILPDNSQRLVQQYVFIDFSSSIFYLFIYRRYSLDRVAYCVLYRQSLVFWYFFLVEMRAVFAFDYT